MPRFFWENNRRFEIPLTADLEEFSIMSKRLSWFRGGVETAKER
jgi:hypothetical protein